MLNVGIAAWVNDSADARERELRMAIHTILTAVGRMRNAGELPVVMKGGILVALGYDSDRYTRDVDFSTSELAEGQKPAQFAKALDAALAAAANALPYGLDCRVQSEKLEPPGPDKRFQTLRMTVGYAPLTDTRRHERLAQKKSGRYRLCRCQLQRSHHGIGNY